MSFRSSITPLFRASLRSSSTVSNRGMSKTIHWNQGSVKHPSARMSFQAGAKKSEQV